MSRGANSYFEIHFTRVPLAIDTQTQLYYLSNKENAKADKRHPTLDFHSIFADNKPSRLSLSRPQMQFSYHKDKLLRRKRNVFGV